MAADLGAFSNDHLVMKWNAGADSTVLFNGGYCIWGQFAAIFDRGRDPSHLPWISVRAKPAGYGSYP